MLSFVHNFSDRLIGYQTNDPKAPTVVVFGGMHGNENAGVKALQVICEYLEKQNIQLMGNFYAIQGNLKALAQNKRFVDLDLNRLWTSESIKEIANSQSNEVSESSELIQLYDLLKAICNAHSGAFYFLDIHTTSSFSVPFITISDSLNNRRFASKFKIPTILGIEEYLEGPLLSYLNEFGHVSLGFEAGQHNEESSVVTSIDCIWKTLRFSKCLSRKEYKAFARRQLLKQRMSVFYHIVYQYTIQSDESFVMKKGFSNFRKIKKETPLAFSNGKLITSPKNGFIFMPLYQKQGNDGFFVIRKISLFWIGLSVLLRKMNVHFLMKLLPGVEQEDQYTLKIDPKIVVFLGQQIFHLLGYRKKIKKGTFWYYTRRDRKIQPFC